MRKLKLMLTLVALLMATGVWAQEDVTANYLTNADFSSIDGWTPVTSSDYKDYGVGVIGTYKVRSDKPAATVDGTHLATENCMGVEARWSNNFAALTQTIKNLSAGSYTLEYDVENTNSSTTSATYENRFTVTVGGTVYTDSKTEWMSGKSSWTSHKITFSVAAASSVTISLGYGTGSNNIGSANTPVVYVSHLKLWQKQIQEQDPMEQDFMEYAIPLTVDEPVYIYNKGQGKFLNCGEAWGTQSIVAEKGFVYQVKDAHALNNTLPEATYYFWSAEAGNSGWMARIATDGRAGGLTCFSDGNSNHNSNGTANQIAWTINPLDDNFYTIEIPAGFDQYIESTRQYLGVVPSHVHGSEGQADGTTNAVWWDIDFGSQADNCSWAFISVKLIYADEKLKPLIETATAEGISAAAIAAAQNAYDNRATLTYAELVAAYTNLSLSSASVDDPVFVDLISNNTPTSNANGWTCPNGQPTFDATNNCAEFWNRSGYSMEQTVANVPAGVYELQVIAMTRTGMKGYIRVEKSGQVIAEENIPTVPSGTVNSRAQANAWFNAGNGLVKLMFELGEASDIKISLVTDATTGDHWTAWRSFKLYYLGKDMMTTTWETFGFWYDQMNTKINQKDFDGETALSDYKGCQMESVDQLMNLFFDEDGGIPTWHDAYVNNQTDQLTVTSEQILDKIEICDSLYGAAVLDIKLYTIHAGSDVTFLMKNPDYYSDGGTLEGWTVRTDVNDYGRQYKTPTWFNNFHRVLESWNGDFNISQDFVLPRTGVYSVSTHGYYRTADHGAWTIWKENNGANSGANETRAFFYADNMEKPLPNICNRTYTRAEIETIAQDYDDEVKAQRTSGNYLCSEYPYDFQLAEGDESTGLYIPNGVYSADYIFTHPNYSPYYEAKFTFIARAGRKVKFGIKGENVGVPASEVGWTLFDQLQLIYDGDDHSVLDPFMIEVVDQAKAIASSPMNGNVRTMLQGGIDAYENAADGNAMMDAYDIINEAIGPARSSILIYQPLVHAQDSLKNEINKYLDMEFNPVRDNAIVQRDDVQSGINNGIYETESEIEEIVNGIYETITNLYQFDPLTYPWPINAAELDVLRAVKQTTGSQGQFDETWNQLDGTAEILQLTGIGAVAGKVKTVNLSGKNLSGDLLPLFLQLPYVEEIYIDNNQINSNLQEMTPNSSLRILNARDNLITGNAGVIATLAPNLERLDLRGNCLTEVNPPLPTSIRTVYLSGQKLNQELDYQQLVGFSGDLSEVLPPILLYNLDSRNYDSEVYLILKDKETSPTWSVIQWLSGMGSNLFTNGSLSPVFKGQSGDVLFVEDSNKGHKLTMKLEFEAGDANFDSNVDVLDLQTNILYIMEKYQATPYNFSAANLWIDELINVQDIICQVNLLLEEAVDEEESAGSRRNAPAVETHCDAALYIQDGYLMLNTNQAVAAFDIVLDGAKSLNVVTDLERMGISVSTKVQRDGLHLVGYSLNGTSIPVGTTAIGKVDNKKASVRRAMLSDAEAQSVSVSCDGTATGINMIESSPRDNSDIYDLQGRKVSNMSPRGVYIKNGHKVVK